MSDTPFKQAWEVLNRHATTLRTQTEPNIDDLLGIVTESVQAYKVCISRVEAVEQALEEALRDSAEPRVARSAVPEPRDRPGAAALDDDLDEDIAVREDDDDPPF